MSTSTHGSDQHPGKKHKKKGEKKSKAHAQLITGLANVEQHGPRGLANVEQHGPRGPPQQLLDADAVLEFFGNINLSTLYRGINKKVYPRPINVSANVVRWLLPECERALGEMIARRDAGARTTPRHGGRKRRAVA